MLLKAVSVANAQAWRDFLLSEYRRRDFQSYRDFGRWLDVSIATVSKALDVDEPALPGLEFLLKVHKATGVALTDLIELVYPEAVVRSDTPVSARLLAQQIEALPPDMRDAIKAIVRGALERRAEGGK
jgi:hypothetical protein